MTAEKPRARPVPKLEIPQEGMKRPEKEAGKTLNLSSETVVASAVVSEKLAEGKLPTKAEVKTVVEHTAEDLKKEGLSVTKSDIEEASERLHETISPSALRESEEKQLLPKDVKEITFGDYQKTLGDLMKTYGLDKGKWKMIAGMLSANEVGWTALEGLKNHALTDGFNILLATLNEASKVAGFQSTEPHKWARFKGLDRKLKWKALTLALQGSWPIWADGVRWLAEGKIKQHAQNIFLDERARLQDMVNTRVSTALFMGDFAKYHDMPASTIMQIIDRGKLATVELVATTYFDLIPSLARLGSYPIGQALAYDKEYSPFAVLAAVAKMPILAIKTLKNAREQQVMNTQELKAWDDINRELMTTLTNLETVRASGKAYGGAVDLKGILAESDYIGAGGLRQKMQNERTMNLLFDVVDVGVPAVWRGVGLFSEMKRLDAEGVPYSAEDVVKALWQVIGKAQYAKGEQMMVRQAFQQVMSTYVDRVIPHIQDIQRMEELLGPYEALDLPGGEREEKRVGVDTLKSYNISVKHLSYKNILNDVSVDIPQGSFTAIKGPSGLGKTTLLRQIVGLYAPEGGEITVGGVATDHIKKYGDQALINQIGYAGQNAEFLEGWTLRENLLLGNSEASAEQIDTVMHDLGLDHLKDRLDSTIKHFSGGEKRRIGIARALFKQPKILILDEPTAHLDEKSTQQVLDIIAGLRKKKPNMTVLAITHDPAFEKIAERIIDFADVNKKMTESPQALSDHQVLEAVARPK